MSSTPFWELFGPTNILDTSGSASQLQSPCSHPQRLPYPSFKPSSSSTTTRHTRSFPPPALQNVPIQYILEQLHNLALNYWDKPQTADCTIGMCLVSPKRSSYRDGQMSDLHPVVFDTVIPIVPHGHPTCNSTLHATSPNNTFSGSAGLGRLSSESSSSSTRPTHMTSKVRARLPLCSCNQNV